MKFNNGDEIFLKYQMTEVVQTQLAFIYLSGLGF